MANLLSLWRNFFSLFSARQFFLPTLAVFNSIGQIFYLLKTFLSNYRVTLATFFKVKILLYLMLISTVLAPYLVRQI